VVSVLANGQQGASLSQLVFALLAASSLYVIHSDVSLTERRYRSPTTVNSPVVVSSCPRRSDVRATRVTELPFGLS
jgi:hypothetical protein